MRKWRETVDLSHFHRIREQLARASIALSAYNLSFKDHFSDAEIERGFEMAAALGAPVITSSSNIKTVSRVAAAAYGTRCSSACTIIRTSKPNEFASRKSLEDALKASPFIAVNLDIGHFTAANEDAVTFLQQHHERIVTLHIKDRKRDQGPLVPLAKATRRLQRCWPCCSRTAGRSPRTSNTNTRAAIPCRRSAGASTIAERPWAYNPRMIRPFARSGQRPFDSLRSLSLPLTGATLNAQAPMLTAAEKAAGWKLLFDGKSLAGWRGYKTETPPTGWRAENGVLIRDGEGGDLMTAEQYGDFEMRFDWQSRRAATAE